jgi:hypothetical protein
MPDNLPAKKSEFEQKVEFLAREMCKEMGVDPNGEGPSLHAGWRAYDERIRCWLEEEAFRRVRAAYWDRESAEEMRKKRK